MRRIYLDNAATTWPKPPAVYEAMDRYMREIGAAAGRGAYRDAVTAEREVLRARSSLARIVGAKDPQRIVFTSNGTDSLNLALHGLLRPGNHVVTSSAEHNSTLRPLRYLEEHRDVAVTRVPCDAAGRIDADEVLRAVRPATRLIALVHASNVTGVIQPIDEIARGARERGIFFLLDAAQSLGHVPIDVGTTPIDLIAAPGHKGLLGPLGTGILYVGEGVEEELEPIRQGGTGTDSESDRQPDSLPDRYESGNLNLPGIVGLSAGVEYLLHSDRESLRRHELEVTQTLLDGLATIPGLTVFGGRSAADRVGVVSFRVGGYDPQEIAAHLDAAFSIQVRAGLHCAPGIHAALGTLAEGGTVRVSCGPFTTRDDMEAALAAVAEIAGSEF